MSKFAAIADKLSAEWFDRAPYAALSGDLAPANIAEAYEAQAAVQEKLAERRGQFAGRKIALASKTMQEMVGIDHPPVAHAQIFAPPSSNCLWISLWTEIAILASSRVRIALEVEEEKEFSYFLFKINRLREQRSSLR